MTVTVDSEQLVLNKCALAYSTPGEVVEFSPDEAEAAGAFAEDAIELSEVQDGENLNLLTLWQSKRN